MGGHGALTIALKQPDRYRSVSAFAPIVAPSQVAWGRKAFSGYLGEDPAAWARYDACELVQHQRFGGTILIDQGDADKFLETQLRPQLFESACRKSGQALTLRLQPGCRPQLFLHQQLHRRPPAPPRSRAASAWYSSSYALGPQQFLNWSMRSPKPLLAKLLGLVFNLD